MSSNGFDVKSLPLYRQISLIGGAVLFISLFFPWFRYSVDAGGFGGRLSGSESGWNGIGALVGILAVLLVAWEVIRILGAAAQVEINHELITAGLSALAALFGLIQFIRALTFADTDGVPAQLGVSTGPHVGAFLILICALALGYAAFLAFQGAGGTSALKQMQANASGQQAPVDPQTGQPYQQPPAHDESGSPQENSRPAEGEDPQNPQR